MITGPVLPADIPRDCKESAGGIRVGAQGPASGRCFRGAVCTYLLDLAAGWAALPSPSSAWAVTQGNRPDLSAARSGPLLQYGFWFALGFFLLREAHRYSFF